MKCVDWYRPATNGIIFSTNSEQHLTQTNLTKCCSHLSRAATYIRLFWFDSDLTKRTIFSLDVSNWKSLLWKTFEQSIHHGVFEELWVWCRPTAKCRNQIQATVVIEKWILETDHKSGQTCNGRRRPPGKYLALNSTRYITFAGLLCHQQASANLEILWSNLLLLVHFSIWNNKRCTFSLQFDPAFYRHQAARVSFSEHFKPTGKSLYMGFYFIVAPIAIFYVLMRNERDSREKRYRNGEVAYTDRQFKFVS